MQDPNHTPHPEVPASGFYLAIERTAEKFMRDFAVNLIAVAPLMVTDGSFEPRLFLPTVGLAVWRTVRDVIPALVAEVK